MQTMNELGLKTTEQSPDLIKLSVCAAEFAILSQSACNLSGLVHSWGHQLSNLWVIARSLNRGTDWVNKHPVNILLLAQLAHLAGGTFGDFELYDKASNWCRRCAAYDLVDYEGVFA